MQYDDISDGFSEMMQSFTISIGEKNGWKFFGAGDIF